MKVLEWRQMIWTWLVILLLTIGGLLTGRYSTTGQLSRLKAELEKVHGQLNHIPAERNELASRLHQSRPENLEGFEAQGLGLESIPRNPSKETIATDTSQSESRNRILREHKSRIRQYALESAAEYENVFRRSGMSADLVIHGRWPL